MILFPQTNIIAIVTLLPWFYFYCHDNRHCKCSVAYCYYLQPPTMILELLWYVHIATILTLLQQFFAMAKAQFPCSGGRSTPHEPSMPRHHVSYYRLARHDYTTNRMSHLMFPITSVVRRSAQPLDYRSVKTTQSNRRPTGYLLQSQESLEALLRKAQG